MMMLFKCHKKSFVGLIPIYLCLQGAAGFFVKHVNTGMCINDTSQIQSNGSDWGNLSFVELSNNCLDPAAQFRFRDNGAMLNLKGQGCLAAQYKNGSGYDLNMFYIYVALSLNESACAVRLDEKIYRNITQTSGGALSVYYKGYEKSSFETWCAVPATYESLATNQGIDPYIKLTTSCNGTQDQRFHFGSVICYGNTTENANCPRHQYMVVKTASYRNLSDTKTCGSSDDYDCQVDVTCLVKKQCDGHHECDVAVDDNLFSGDSCQGMNRYLYFEYQCIDTSRLHYLCVKDVRLSNSSLPNEGLVQIITDSGTKSVCTNSLKNPAGNTVCRHLGYGHQTSSAKKAFTSETKDALFSDSIYCNNQDRHLSRCSVTNSTNNCSELSYIKCYICKKPLKERIPDSSFTASASSEGHNASDARISSGSSWCAPLSDVQPYLQVDLRILYVLDNIAIFGDSTSAKWVTSYSLNHTTDLMTWKQFQFQDQKIFEGPKNAYNYAAIQRADGLTTRALRLISLKFVVQACMRIEICGTSLLPDEPRNLTVTNIKSRSAEISWLKPENEGTKPVDKFWIKLKKDNTLLQNKTTKKVNEYEINNLTPFTSYEVSVAAGNENGFGEENVTSFTTSEEAPDGPPLNITVTAENSSSLLVTWEPPAENKRNGIIVNYTVCLSQSESKPCFREYTTEERRLVVSNLNASTKYFLRVLASTKVGRGNNSKSEGKFTNGIPPKEAENGTETTLTFSLQIPSQNYTYFYVVALKLTNGKDLKSPESYSNDDLVTYAEAKKSTNPEPYIAAVVTSSTVAEQTFILGDGRSTSNPTTRRRRSTPSNYYNGPLEPGTGYSIFQRVFINEADVYSTDWSPLSNTTPRKEMTVTPSQTTRPSGGDMSNDDMSNDGSSNIGVIVGAVVGVCVLILVVLVISIIRRRKGKQVPKPAYALEIEVGEMEKPSVSFAVNEAYQVSNDFLEEEQNANVDDEDVAQVEKNKNDFDPDENIYDNKQSIAAQIHNPIPVAEFSDHVNKLRQGDNEELKLEYEDLPTARTSSWDISKRPRNQPKNRYGNAITYDHSRVILSGDEKTDYINASFIDGWKEKYYIATQGPKPNTVNDFWRMIFEQKCPTIVMLTSLKESGKVKCEKYWPDESGTYGEIKVTADKTKTFADYVTRLFTLEKDNEKHGVQQFHFKSWPDHGVPSYPTQMLTFRRHLKSFHETKTGPVVVHCSAGVGRTGVFIAVDKILDDLDKEKKESIDIFGFVKDMRTRRVNMVQTAEQYMFIHDAVVDHIKCGANEVEATQVAVEIKHLSEKNEKGETGFDEKFKRLNKVSPQLVKEQCEAALLEGSKKKNRKPEIFPSESGRIHLMHLEDVENSDYINASYVDGYLGKNYFIATQTPLQETINDFWRMVFQQNSSTIVMLNQLREGDEEYPMFWPTQRAKPEPFGPTTIMLDSFNKKDSIVIRKFAISPSPDLKDGRMVRMIQYLSWPDHGVPENVGDILKILSEVEESQRAAETKGPVIVMCSDGAGRSGTYIVISNLVDRVKVVQVIDVFQCIKLIRSKRPQFVETAAQFKLCYDAVSSFLNSFNEYSNFTLN